jgi:hypothetical protein
VLLSRQMLSRVQTSVLYLATPVPASAAMTQPALGLTLPPPGARGRPPSARSVLYATVYIVLTHLYSPELEPLLNKNRAAAGTDFSAAGIALADLQRLLHGLRAPSATMIAFCGWNVALEPLAGISVAGFITVSRSWKPYAVADIMILSCCCRLHHGRLRLRNHVLRLIGYRTPRCLPSQVHAVSAH